MDSGAHTKKKTIVLTHECGATIFVGTKKKRGSHEVVNENIFIVG